jgi:hypothetical protein
MMVAEEVIVTILILLLKSKKVIFSRLSGAGARAEIRICGFLEPK